MEFQPLWNTHGDETKKMSDGSAFYVDANDDEGEEQLVPTSGSSAEIANHQLEISTGITLRTGKPVTIY